MNRNDEQAQLDATARVATLFGISLPPEEPPDVVGWCLPAPGGSVKGKAHRCIDCQPERPGVGWDVLVRSRLAARERCTVCSRRLEDVTNRTRGAA